MQLINEASRMAQQVLQSPNHATLVIAGLAVATLWLSMYGDTASSASS